MDGKDSLNGPLAAAGVGGECGEEMDEGGSGEAVGKGGLGTEGEVEGRGCVWR